MAQVNHNRALLKVAADGRIAEQRENIIAFAKAVGNSIVARTVIELVMILVMRRRPGKSREAVKERYPIIRDMVQQRRFPHRHMVMVVRNHGNNHSQVQCTEIKYIIESNAPLDKQDGRCQGKKNKGLDVGFVLQQSMGINVRR